MASLLTQASGATPTSCGIESISRVYESDEQLVVLVRLADGVLELRVPEAAVSKRPEKRHIPGFNPDATPC